MIKTKKFDQNLYDENDSIAKTIIMNFLKQQGYEVEINSNQYGPDLVTKDWYFECEVKHNWKGKKFPFKTIQFPYRKNKFLHADKPVYFCMLNTNHTVFLMVSDDTLRESNVKPVSNKYIDQDEYFFDVPVEKAEFFEL